METGQPSTLAVNSGSENRALLCRYQVMQFGRIDNNAYTLDFQYPYSAVQAFAVALANVTQRLKWPCLNSLRLCRGFGRLSSATLQTASNTTHADRRLPQWCPAVVCVYVCLYVVAIGQSSPSVSAYYLSPPISTSFRQKILYISIASTDGSLPLLASEFVYLLRPSMMVLAGIGA